MHKVYHQIISPISPTKPQTMAPTPIYPNGTFDEYNFTDLYIFMRDEYIYNREHRHHQNYSH